MSDETTNYGVGNIEALTDSTSNIAPAERDTAKSSQIQPHHIDESDQLALDDTKTPLNRETQDGKGDDEVPLADFASFATEGVEDDGETAEFDTVVNEVLAGKWGGAQERRQRLLDAGHSVFDVNLAVNRRLAGGAPSSLEKQTIKDTARQVIWGEWGSSPTEIDRNLDGAGYVSSQVWSEVRRQSGK